MSTVTNAVAKRTGGPVDLIAEYRDDLALVAPSHVNPDKLYRTMIGLLRGNDALARAAAGNPGSFIAAVFECAELGHRPGDTYHFVPFGNKITGIEDYKGEIERMYRAGAVVSVKAEIVYANDTYDFDEEVMDRPRHTRDRFGGKAARGKMIGVYAYAVMRGGALSRVVEMGEEEVMEHKAASRGGSGTDSPWVKWPRSMWLKTAVHELAKWVPTSNEYLTDQARAQGEMLRHANKPTSAPPAQTGVVGPPATSDVPVRVEPVHSDPPRTAEPVQASAVRLITEPQLRKLHATFADKGLDDRDIRLNYIKKTIGREVGSSNELTTREASQVIDGLNVLPTLPRDEPAVA